MTVFKKDPAKAPAPGLSPTASKATVGPDKRPRDELADKDLDNVSGGPTAVERNPKPI